MPALISVELFEAAGSICQVAASVLLSKRCIRPRPAKTMPLLSPNETRRLLTVLSDNETRSFTTLAGRLDGEVAGCDHFRLACVLVAFLQVSFAASAHSTQGCYQSPTALRAYSRLKGQLTPGRLLVVPCCCLSWLANPHLLFQWRSVVDPSQHERACWACDGPWLCQLASCF